MAEMEIAERLRLGGGVNVGRTERIASAVGGAALAALGARERGVRGTVLGLLGLALVHRGVSGHCAVYGTMGVDTAGRGGGGRRRLADDAAEDAAVSVSASVTVKRPAEELYAFWRDFRNAPRYMDRIVRVEVLDDLRSRWTASGPTGQSWEWESEVTEDVPGELIAWESLPGSELPNRGWVQFIPAREGQAEVRYFVEFDPPAGIVGQAIARVFHEAPREMARADLRRFRALMESGEAAATAGAREEWGTDAGA